MAMNVVEAQKHVNEMAAFITDEAKAKAAELDAKAFQEFEIEKARMVNQSRDKIRQEYAKKAKQVETSCAIKRSLAINRSRLEKIKCRQQQLSFIAEGARAQIAQALAAEGKRRDFYLKLMVQGLLMLLEDDVVVRCRKEDLTLVQGCLAEATANYAKIVKEETGARKAVKLTIDQVNSLPPGPTPGNSGPTCLGGVVLSCEHGAINVNNTVDTRLDLTMEQDKPTIRKLLFPALK